MASSSNYTARSLANNYELTLLEANHLRQLPSSSELYKCFQVFDEIIPMLGQYKRVMKMIRDQAYEAVFSRQYTVDVEAETVVPTNKEAALAKKASIERVPYFEILNKIVNERNSRAEIAEEQVQQLKSVVEELNEEIGVFKKTISEVEEAISNQREEIHDLQTRLVGKEQENNRLDIELRYQQEKMNRKLKEFENSIQNVHEQLAVKNNKVCELSRFKQCHAEVQNNFRDPTIFSPVPQRGLFSAKEQKLRNDIAEGTTIEKQLLLLRNTCIDEYDQYLERCNSKEKLEGEPSWGEDQENDEPDEQASKEGDRDTAFVNMISNIEKELAQNVLHLSILKNDLDKLNEVKRQQKTEKMLTHGGGGQSMEDESELLELIRDASINYKFVPQEPLLSKYALVALYSCNQGKTFQELPSVQKCKSCAANTLVCPHKVTTGERVFHLPLQCTHIKFTRPEVRTPHPSKSDTGTPVTSMKEVSSHKAYSRLWNDLELREGNGHQRTSRVLKEQLLISLIEQFYAFIVQEDTDNGSEKPISLLETWYAFLNDRYQSNTVAVLVARDVLETIQSTTPPHPFVQMFAECLCGNLDPAVFRYYLILRRLIEIVHWTSLENFSAFSNVIYPFMDVDDLEQFTMSYRAFSENRIDETLVRKFFLSLILKQREPAFHDMENQLLSRPEVSSGIMTDIAFFESMAEISPLSSERLCQRLFAQSLADTDADHVSVSRLSHIASYLVLNQQSPVMEMEIRKNVQTK